MRRKTTIYLDESQDRATKTIARAEGRSQAEVIREAIERYVAAAAPPPSSIGVGRSGGGSVADRKREWLEGLGSR